MRNKVAGLSVRMRAVQQPLLQAQASHPYTGTLAGRTQTSGKEPVEPEQQGRNTTRRAGRQAGISYQRNDTNRRFAHTKGRDR